MQIKRYTTFLGAFLLSGLIVCSRSDKPVPIQLNEDSCDQCYMTFTDRKFASEVVEGARVLKFDDLVCLANYIRVKGRPSRQSKIWVVDFNTGEWISAESAFYVRSSQVPSPMASGLAAFKSLAAARDFAERNQGQVIEFDEVLQSEIPGGNSQLLNAR